MKVSLHRIEERERKYAVIITYEKGQFLLVRHSSRTTWEVPGGHHENGETILETARRELFEETGALEYELKHISDYSVETEGRISYGGLFQAKIGKRGPLPDFEIAEVKRFNKLPDLEKMTYGRIQHQLIKLVKELEDE